MFDGKNVESMRTILGFFVAGLFFCFTIQTSARQINTEASEVSFRIGNMRINTVSGTFGGMTGQIDFNPDHADQSHFNVCIDAASVHTGNRKRDDHLREAGFFHVEQYPEICFESIAVSKTSNGFNARGKLTIKGVTRAVTIPFTQEGNMLTGTFSLNRLDYELGESFGTFFISNPVEVTIRCVLLP